MRAHAKVLPRHDCHAHLLAAARRRHVQASVLADLAEGRVDGYEDDVRDAVGRVLKRHDRLDKVGGLARDANLNLMRG
jgi:hypothetical protein